MFCTAPTHVYCAHRLQLRHLLITSVLDVIPAAGVLILIALRCRLIEVVAEQTLLAQDGLDSDLGSAVQGSGV